MPTDNKVLFGLKNAHYAKITYSSGVPSWATPVAMPGAVSLALSKEGDESPFYADDVKYYNVVANNGYSGTLELAKIPLSFYKDILGYTETSTGKMAVEDASVQGAEFALMFECTGDVSPERFCMYRCTAQRPDIAGDTKADTITVKTQTINITAMPVIDTTSSSPINGKTLYHTTPDTPSATFEAFYSAVDTTLA